MSKEEFFTCFYGTTYKFIIESKLKPTMKKLRCRIGVMEDLNAICGFLARNVYMYNIRVQNMYIYPTSHV